MTTKEAENQTTVPAFRRFEQIGKGVVLAGAVAVLALTPPTSAYAGGNGAGAAIGLGILGATIAGAAIASTAPPAYGYGPPPTPAYYYPPQPYQGYYAPAPYYDTASQPYYGWTPYR